MSRRATISSEGIGSPAVELRSRVARAVAISPRVHVQTRLDRLRRRVRDATFGSPDFATVRDDLARRYLVGAGVELGAMHRPLRTPARTAVRYVDRLTVDELRARYPEYAEHWMVEPDVIDDATSLRAVADASADFLIANHVLEHLQDPIRALSSWTRVVRGGGVLYLAVPDKHSSFDAARPSTTLEHLDRDFAEGPAWSQALHYLEYAALAERVPAGEVERRAETLAAGDVDIHFHVWDRQELLAFVAHVATAHRLPVELEAAQANDGETLLVLRRT